MPPATASAGVRERTASSNAPAHAPIGCVAAAPPRQSAAHRGLSCAAPNSARPMAIAVGFPPQSKKICGVRESSTATAATVRAAGARNGPWSTAERPAQKTRYDAAAASRPARASPSGDSSEQGDAGAAAQAPLHNDSTRSRNSSIASKRASRTLSMACTQGADCAWPVTVPIQTVSPERASVASRTTTAEPFPLLKTLACGWSSGGASGPTGWTGLAGGRSVRRGRVFSSPSVASRRATVRTHGRRSKLLVSAPASLNEATSALYARCGRSCEICPHPMPGVGRAAAGTGTHSFAPRSARGSAVRRVCAGVQAAISSRRMTRFIESNAPGSNTPGGLEVKVRGPSDIEVERELHRRRPQPHRVQLLLHLGVDPRLDHVGGEHVALEQELVVPLQLPERLLQGSRHLRNVLQLLRREPVDVLVQRVARIDAVLDAVEASHEHGGERQVRVAARVRGAELDALGFGAR